MTDRIRLLLREPALLIDLAETIVLMVIAFGVGLSGDQQTYIVATVVALLGLGKAFLTKPFPPAAITDLGRAALALFASFGVGLSADQIVLAVTALGLMTTIVLRGQLTPTHDPVVSARGAGAGPVVDRSDAADYTPEHRRDEAGEFGLLHALAIVGLVLVVLVVLMVVGVLR